MRTRGCLQGAALPVLVLLLAACGGAPAAVESRPSLPTCGDFESLNEPLTVAQRRMNDCILEAFAAGRPAELIVTTATVEGDPITAYVRVLGSGRVEVFVDTTRDSYGSQGWLHQACAELGEGPDGSLGWGRCRDVPLQERIEPGV